MLKNLISPWDDLSKFTIELISEFFYLVSTQRRICCHLVHFIGRNFCAQQSEKNDWIFLKVNCVINSLKKTGKLFYINVRSLIFEMWEIILLETEAVDKVLSF